MQKYIDEVDANYRAFPEMLIRILKEDEASRDLASCELQRPRDGFRFATVYFTVGPPVHFYQPWGGNEI